MPRKVTRSPLGSIKAQTPPVVPGQRIGLMGGSFNPPHEGHLHVAETALKRLRLDRVWWMVSPGNPLKRNDGLPPLAERMAAARALATDPRIEVTGFEDGLRAPHYTAAALAFLHARHPKARFVWIMGADNLAQFHKWREWRSIAATTPFVVVDRPGWRMKALASPVARALTAARLPEDAGATLAGRAPPAWVFLTARLSQLSSTALRGLRAGRPASGKSTRRKRA
jgi:nicotinate-nucleotide adenylyltransferase